MDTEQTVRDAANGNQEALKELVAAIQDNIYYLALRMLANPEDAKDATQEILIKVITKLSTFQFKSQFSTWAHKIAVNHLITEKKLLSKDPGLSFDVYKQDLESDLQAPTDGQDNPNHQILLNELRISCTMAMLLCLKPTQRMIYILGEIYELDHVQASELLSISRDNYRQQLSRARHQLTAFITASCSLVNHCAACSCDKKLAGALKRKRVLPEQMYFANDQQYAYNEIRTSLSETQHALKALALQQAINHYKSPIDLSAMLESLVSQAVRANQNKTLNQRMKQQ